jgi:hypothetical protein
MDLQALFQNESSTWAKGRIEGRGKPKRQKFKIAFNYTHKIT